MEEDIQPNLISVNIITTRSSEKSKKFKN